MKNVIAPIGVVLALVGCSEYVSPPAASSAALVEQSGFGRVRIRPNHITFVGLSGGQRKVRISQRGYSFGLFTYSSGGPFCQPNATATLDGFDQSGAAIFSIYPTAQVAHGCPMKFLGAGNRKARLFVTVQ